MARSFSLCLHVGHIHPGMNTLHQKLNTSTSAHMQQQKWRVLSAGHYHTCGVTDDGEARCWGSSVYGATEAPKNVSVWSSVDVGRFHSCGISGDGSAWYVMACMYCVCVCVYHGVCICMYLYIYICTCIHVHKLVCNCACTWFLVLYVITCLERVCAGKSKG